MSVFVYGRSPRTLNLVGAATRIFAQNRGWDESTGLKVLMDGSEVYCATESISGNLLDRDIAALYGVETKVLNQAVKRNAERFPDGFMFQLSDAEWTDLRSQIVTSKRGGQRYRPYVFTEHGIVMLASVLKSDAAVQASVRIVSVFVAMRRVLSSLAPVLSRVETVERRLIGLEDAQKQTSGNVAMILDAMRDKKFPPQKVFFDGEFFDAFVQMKKFVRQAKKDLVVIDPYFDDTCLPLIAQKRPGVTVMVVRSAHPRR